MSIVRTDTRHPILKHPGSDGSDTHDTGTGQEVHAPGSGQGSRAIAHPKGGTGQVTSTGTELLHVTEQSGLVAEDVYLHDAAGNEVPLSHEAFLALGTEDGAAYAEQVNTLFERYGLDSEAIDPNIDRIYQSALLRYQQMNEAGATGEWVAGEPPSWMQPLLSAQENLTTRPWVDGTPEWVTEVSARIDSLAEIEDGRWRFRPGAGDSLAELDRFYSLWNRAFTEGAAGFDLPTLTATAATISPRLDAWRNLEFTLDLAQAVHDNPQITSRWADILTAKAAELEAKKVLHGPEGSDPNSRRWNAGHEARLADLQGALELHDQGPVTLNDIPDYAGAIVAHNYRKEVLKVGSKLAPGYQTGSGYNNYAKALSLLQGDLPISDVLNGVKTRSFSNNIADPTDQFGRRDSTMDIWAIDAALGGRGYGDLTSIVGGATFQGVGVGLRAVIKDGYDRVATRNSVIPLHLQEVVWAEFKRGLGNDISTTFTHADGSTVEMTKAPKK
jgi:hypothetical protein